jgi:hypothetical protein
MVILLVAAAAVEVLIVLRNPVDPEERVKWS